MTYLGSSITTGRHHLRDWLRAQQAGPEPIRTIAEFGVGGGKMGELLRAGAPAARIVGCDGYEEAVATHRARPGRPYDAVHHAEAVDFLAHPDCRADCWAWGDVLEHLPEQTADVLMGRAAKLGVRFVLLSIPVGEWPQEAHPRNHLEEHLWTFYPSKIKQWPEWGVERSVVVSVNKLKGPRRVVHVDSLDDQEMYRRHQDEFLGHFVLRSRAA